MAVNIFGKNNNEKTGLETNNFLARPYQKEAISTISNFVKNLFRGLLNQETNSIFKNAVLLNMATGSGKTFTLGKSLDKIIKIRNYYNKINKKNEFENLNIIVLTHRIDLVNQLRDDLVFGRDDKKAILSPEILENLHISTYHSKADEDDNILDDEELDLGNGTSKDKIIFSTHQTAGLIGLVDKLDYVDIILIDESHNVRLDSSYLEVLKNLSKKSRFGNESLIIPVTATPNNHTTKLFGDDKFDYGIEKYLNSDYSPSVEYNLVTNSNVDTQLLNNLSSTIELAKHETNHKLKKKLLSKSEEIFNEIMTSFVNNNSLVDDLFDRLGELEETVIFVDSIKSADELAEIINHKVGINDFALGFHSKNDANNAIEKLRDKNDNCKFILSIGKLNEGIDLPKVKNVVFWRGTDSETIFLQQFGRGLRGNDLVRYYDYVGGIKNFAWINSIYLKYSDLAKKNNDEKNTKNSSETGKINKFSLIGSNMGTNQHNINLFNVGLFISSEKEEFNVSKEEIREYFKTIKETEEESYEYWMNLNRKEIKDVEFKGNKIKNLGKIFGWEKSNNLSLQTPKGFKNFVNFLFHKENENISKENIINYFKTIKKTEEESYEYWINFIRNEITNIEYKGNKIITLGTKSGWENMNNLNILTPKGFKEFVNFLFHKENENMTKESIINYFKTIKETEEESYEYLINLNQKEIQKIEFIGNKISSLGTKSGWENLNNLNILTPKGFKNFVNFLFHKENENISKENIINYFKTIKKTEEESYEYWINLTLKEMCEIEYIGHKIVKLGTIIGWKNPNNLDIKIPKGFKEFINYIFDKESENLTKENIICYFKTLKETEDESYKYLINLSNKEIKIIEYKGNKIKSLGKKSGWKNINNLNMQTPKGFQELINYIFDKKD